MDNPLNISCHPMLSKSLHLVTDPALRFICPNPGAFLVIPLLAPAPALPSPEAPRPTRVHFRGACGSATSGLRLRALLPAAFRHAPAAAVSCGREVLDDAVGRELAAAALCLIVPSRQQSVRRLAEAVLAGCVPVFVGPPFAAMPFAPALDYGAFSLHVLLRDARWMEPPQRAPGGANATAASTAPAAAAPDGADAYQSHNTSWVARLPASVTRPLIALTLADVPPLLARLGRLRLARLRSGLAAAARPAFEVASAVLGEGPTAANIAYSAMCAHVGAEDYDAEVLQA